MRTDQLDPSLLQPQTQGVAANRLSIDEPSPLRSARQMPSQHRRSSTRLQPTFFEGFRFSKSGSIIDHCPSVNSDARRLVERLLSMNLVVASPCRAQVQI
jgi:hypothetical protein